MLSIRANDDLLHKEEFRLEVIKAATPKNTRVSHQSYIRSFQNAGYSLPAGPMEVAKYLRQVANNYNPRSLEKHLMAIRKWHISQGLIDPTCDIEVTTTMKGLKRIFGKPYKQAKAFTVEDMVKMVKHLRSKESLTNYRNVALILLSFSGCFRISELLSLEVKNITYEKEGIVILLPRSKTDQNGFGVKKAICYENNLLCPIQALNDWLKKSEITEGPIFRSIGFDKKLSNNVPEPNKINEMIKDLCFKIGMNDPESYSSHSFRRGLATEASLKNASERSIMAQGDWKSTKTVRGYIEQGCMFRDNAAHLVLSTAQV